MVLPSAPRSRRERPAKAALTREGIIDAALMILETEGIGTVTMRRIAAALDTGPASLYVYVRNTEELHAQVLDALLGRADAVPDGGTWRARLHATLTSYAGVLFAYPEIARITAASRPIGPNYYALVESVLELLAEGGVGDREAAWAVDLLLATVTSNAIEHAAPNAVGEGTDALAELATQIAAVPQSTYPRIVRLGDEMLSGTGPERFAWGLDVLINGVLATPRR